MLKFDFAKEFAKIPGPREENIGPNSGEKFRILYLEKWFSENQQVEIDASGTIMAFGPSFLSEAFGKMAKKEGKEKFFNIIHIKNDQHRRNLKLKEAIIKHVDIALSK